MQDDKADVQCFLSNHLSELTFPWKYIKLLVDLGKNHIRKEKLCLSNEGGFAVAKTSDLQRSF